MTMTAGAEPDIAQPWLQRSGNDAREDAGTSLPPSNWSVSDHPFFESALPSKSLFFRNSGRKTGATFPGIALAVLDDAQIGGGDQKHDQAEQNAPRPFRHLQDGEQGGEHRQDQGADDGAGVAAAAAEDRGAADHRSRDRRQ